MRKVGFLLPVLACLAAGEALARDTAGAALVADTVLTNGKVYTLDSGQAWAEAVAIKDGKISFVGSSEQAEQYQGGNTEIIDLDGKMVLPGLNDIHVHPVYGFTVQLFECVFPPGSSADEVARTVSACVADNPDAEWIVGGQWTADFFEKHDIQSPREWLDKLSGNKAVVLRDSSYHNRWVNSKALAKLALLVTRLDKLGLTVKVHTAGDRAVRVTLDAIEHARKANGDSGLRHETAHAGYIHEADIPRFAALNAVPEISPYIWFPSAKVIDPILSAVGERGKRYWPVKSLLEAGAEVAAGSDWPAGALESMNPWVGMEALVSRRNPLDEYPGTLWQEQAITLEQALQIYTLNGAKALKLEQQTGSIEVGKLADIIVLNQNLFDVPIEHISDTQVEMTMFGGNVVYQK